jgi:hypothetical protein
MGAWGMTHWVRMFACVGLAITATRVSHAEDVAGCALYEAEYVIVAHLVVRNTILGAANGEYPMGSGRMKLRVQTLEDHAEVRMISYDTDNDLSIDARIGPFVATVLSRSRTTVTPGPCAGSARGTLRGGTLTWSSSVAGYRTDGTMQCTGSMCGQHGAPPRGESALHEVPPAVMFKAFAFSPDGETFTMPYALISRSETPRQTTYLALAGRRVRQSCIPRGNVPCPG